MVARWTQTNIKDIDKGYSSNKNQHHVLLHMHPLHRRESSTACHSAAAAKGHCTPWWMHVQITLYTVYKGNRPFSFSQITRLEWGGSCLSSTFFFRRPWTPYVTSKEEEEERERPLEDFSLKACMPPLWMTIKSGLERRGWPSNSNWISEHRFSNAGPHCWTVTCDKFWNDCSNQGRVLLLLRSLMCALFRVAPLAKEFLHELSKGHLFRVSPLKVSPSKSLVHFGEK